MSPEGSVYQLEEETFMARADEVPGLGQDGIALITTLILVLISGALVTGAIILGSNQLLVDRYLARQGVLVNLADEGLEVARSYLNADRSLLPDSGFVTFEDGVAVEDGRGRIIPGVQRWTYLGPAGSVSGQSGLFGSVVSVVKGKGGGVVVRRQEIFQDSFARYAYFTDKEGGRTFFAGDDHIWGPLHTNDRIKLHGSRAHFHDEVTTAKDVDEPQNGSFAKGYQEYSQAIPMPEAADLVKLREQAQAGHTYLVGSPQGGEGEATTRIEFIAVDLNGDGDEHDDDEGFFRVYQSNDFRWVSAKPQPRQSCREDGRDGRSCSTLMDLVGAQNCGDYHEGVFVPAPDHDPAIHGHDGLFALKASTRRCFLGGADEIWNGFVPNDGKGQWLPWTGAVNPRLELVRPADAPYLWPLSRWNNPDFRGVVFVDGKVIVSGKVRGRVTVAATDNIILGDDLTYATDPGAGTCEDVAGYFSGQRVVVSNNATNGAWSPSSGEPYLTYDESTGEFFHGIVLALDIFTAEDYASGPTAAQYCEGSRAGRGCLYLTGGVIQHTPGAVGLDDGHGYIRRYSYDKCAATRPPPYFPTTGVFKKGQYYQVDPGRFEAESYFRTVAPGAGDRSGS